MIPVLPRLHLLVGDNSHSLYTVLEHPHNKTTPRGVILGIF